MTDINREGMVDMALIKCPKCGREMSNKAERCLDCGYSISASDTGGESVTTHKNIKNRKILYGAVLVASFIGIIILINAKKDYKSPNMYSSSSYSSTYSSKPKTGKAGALAKAESYLNSSAFSYDGLVKQLEYSGFSSSEAKYAADNCGANWKEQALKEAKSYLDSSAFSYTGLIKQLEYSGFTSDEAKYGADHCGANWKEQASKKAASYLKISDFTRSSLIKQLEYSGFTTEEAIYGVDKNIK
jgi:ribosomal protein L37E